MACGVAHLHCCCSELGANRLKNGFGLEASPNSRAIRQPAIEPSPRFKTGLAADGGPVVHDRDGKTVKEGIERGSLGDDDGAEKEKFPGPVTVEAVASRAQDKRIMAIQAPDLLLPDAFLQKVNIIAVLQCSEGSPAFIGIQTDAEVAKDSERLILRRNTCGPDLSERLDQTARAHPRAGRMEIEPNGEREELGMIASVVVLGVPGDEPRTSEKGMDRLR